MKGLGFLILICSLFSMNAWAISEAPSFNKVVIFGDSLSDNGNLYRSSLHIIPKSPPYYEGRFTNGKTWADIVDDYFSEKDKIKIDNYAVGGETVALHNPFDGFLPYTLKDSINNYFLHTIFQDKSHTLFVIWIGANDYLNGSKDPDAATSTVVNTMKENIESLILNGAKNFLILNLPDLEMTPMAVAYPNIENLHQLTVQNNQKLQALIDNFQSSHPDIIIRSLDVFGIYNDLSNHLAQFNQKYYTHLKNLTDACWSGGYTLRDQAHLEEAILHNLQKDYYRNTTLNKNETSKINLNALAHQIANNPSLRIAYHVGQSYESGGSACEQPDDYGFWDHVHPSAAVHTIIASYLIDNINQFYHLMLNKN